MNWPQDSLLTSRLQLSWFLLQIYTALDRMFHNLAEEARKEQKKE